MKNGTSQKYDTSCKQKSKVMQEIGAKTPLLSLFLAGKSYTLGMQVQSDKEPVSVK